MDGWMNAGKKERGWNLRGVGGTWGRGQEAGGKKNIPTIDLLTEEGKEEGKRGRCGCAYSEKCRSDLFSAVCFLRDGLKR